MCRWRGTLDNPKRGVPERWTCQSGRHPGGWCAARTCELEQDGQDRTFEVEAKFKGVAHPVSGSACRQRWEGTSKAPLRGTKAKEGVRERPTTRHPASLR